jgi:PAS domain S-box-containing protein
MFSSRYSRLIPVIVFGVLAAGTAGAGYLYYERLAAEFSAHVSDQLAAIADLKVGQIESWRRDRLSEAEAAAENPMVTRAVKSFLKDYPKDDIREELMQWLSSYLRMPEYTDAVLCDPLGRVRLWAGSPQPPSVQGSEAIMGDVVREGKPRLLDFHRQNDNYPIHLTLMAPLMEKGLPAPSCVGVLLLKIDPMRLIYPLIQSWPMPSGSAETLLVRKDGEDVLFLNELRHKRDTALKLRVPISQQTLPAAMVLIGKEGVVQGLDYRGVPVLAVLRRIPGTPWGMVSKVDSSEVFAPLRTQGLMVAVVVGGMLLAAGSALTLAWSRRQTAFERKVGESERARRLLNERFDSLSRYANDIILLLHPDGSIAEANERAVEAYGYTREELLKLNVRDLRPPETAGLVAAQMAQVAKKGGIRLETVHMRRDGGRFPVEISSRVLEMDGQDYFQSIVRDITERKDAELRIFHLNRLFAMLSQVNQSIVRARDKEGLFREISRVATAFGKFPFAWVALMDGGGSSLDPVAWSSLDERDGCPVEKWETPSPDFAVASLAAFNENKCIVCNNLENELRPIPWLQEMSALGCCSLAVVVIHHSGAPIGALWVCSPEADFFTEEEVKVLEEIGMDISFAMDAMDAEAKRARAVEELKASEVELRGLYQEFNAILGAIPDSLTLQDRDLTILWANKGAVDAFKVDFPELVGGNCCEVWFGQGAEYSECPVYRCFQSEGPENDIVMSPDGRIWDARTVPIKDDSGAVFRVVQLARDITEQHKMEAQLRQAQKMEAIGVLAGGIAHDFNNILAAIMGYSELALLNAEEGRSVGADLQQILSSAYRARDLVKQILAFSRRSEQVKKPVQLSAVVKETLKLMRASLPTTVEIRQDVSSVESVLADPTQIHQVMMNLCTNSAHAMRENGGMLEVRLEDIDHDPQGAPDFLKLQAGRYVKLTVRDTGHGIEPAVLDKIFDPFFTTKPQGEGTGLGLSVVHGIVKSHDGGIHIDSRPGEGTIVQVLFPVAHMARAPEVESSRALPGGRERILFVDDEPTLSMLGKQSLERLGYEVTAATSSTEALRLFRERMRDNPFHLVVTDMTMPHMTGIELTREMARVNSDIRVILCTGFSERIDAEDVSEEGIKGFLMKPVLLKDLAELVRRILDS